MKRILFSLIALFLFIAANAQDSTNKNRSLESLMLTRNQEADISIPGGSKQNLNKN